MNSIKLQGGMGNQLFQIAMIHSYSKKNNVDYKINFNDCFTPNQGFTSSKYKDTLFCIKPTF